MSRKQAGCPQLQALPSSLSLLFCISLLSSQNPQGLTSLSSPAGLLSLSASLFNSLCLWPSHPLSDCPPCPVPLCLLSIGVSGLPDSFSLSVCPLICLFPAILLFFSISSLSPLAVSLCLSCSVHFLLHLSTLAHSFCLPPLCLFLSVSLSLPLPSLHPPYCASLSPSPSSRGSPSSPFSVPPFPLSTLLSPSFFPSHPLLPPSLPSLPLPPILSPPFISPLLPSPPVLSVGAGS